MLDLAMALNAKIATGGGAAPLVWQTMRTTTLISNEGAWGGNTLRLRIEPAGLVDILGATKIRITLEAATDFELAVTGLYVGLAGTGSSFAAAPTPVTFNGGSATVTVATSQQKLSDEVVLAVDGTAAIIIAIQGPSTYRKNATMSNATAAYKAGDDAATQTAVGYTAYNVIDFIPKIEVYA